MGCITLALGGTWADVLEKLPPSEYTMIHGQCTSVGVAGYILGNLILFVKFQESQIKLTFWLKVGSEKKILHHVNAPPSWVWLL